MSIMTNEDRAALGARYSEIVGPVNEAMDAIEQQLSAEWQGAFDAAERENLWRAVQITRKIREHIGGIVGAGRLATHALTEIRRVGKQGAY